LKPLLKRLLPLLYFAQAFLLSLPISRHRTLKRVHCLVESLYCMTKRVYCLINTLQCFKNRLRFLKTR
jgi:hypothetical protein